MHASQTSGDIDTDYQILDAIGRTVDDLIERFALFSPDLVGL